MKRPYRSGLYSIIGTLLTVILTFTLLPHEALAQAFRSLASSLEPTHTSFAPLLPVPGWPSTTQASDNIGKVQVQVTPNSDVLIKSASGNITLAVPKNAVSTDVTIEIVEKTPVGSNGMKILKLFELNAWDSITKQRIGQFNQNLMISISHESRELRGININSLKLYYLDESSQRWLPLKSSQYDPATMILTATTDHFSTYGEQADPLFNGPGRIMAAQTNMQSGTATFSYPIELPPGPAGFQPRLSLNYNSGVADEMKNKRSTGSWVGIGWTLHLGQINYDSSNDWYFLDLNGASYELFSTNTTNYRTNPEQYFSITRSQNPANTWELRDREGNYYRFGGTTDSEQYFTGGQRYRWDVNLIRDVNGNEATVSYVRETNGLQPGEIRAAYPEFLRYGDNNTIEIHFNSSWDDLDPESSDHLRKDSPQNYYDGETITSPAPRVMEVRKLDSIEIKVSNNLIRKYSFGYNTTDRVLSSEYGWTYYSGKHSLTSVTQIGANGSSQLPSMIFSYQDLQTYRITDETSYTGNPGNPASLSWPHLTAINSGYGGKVTFSYTQTPPSDGSIKNKWTREVVGNKISFSDNVTPVISDNITYTYTTGDNFTYPKYLGSGWDQKYRGFNEVRETDAAGNYVMHYYYPTGVVNNKDAEKLGGREYKTQWFNSSAVELKKKEYDWGWVATGQPFEFVNTWSHDGKGDGLLIPYSDGIAVSADGYTYTTDYDGDSDRVQKFDEHGNFIRKWGSYGTGNGEFSYPRGVAVDSSGNVYVVDSGNHRVKSSTPAATTHSNGVPTVGETTNLFRLRA